MPKIAEQILKIPRVLTVENINSQKPKRMLFTGQFKEAFGSPQSKGVTFIYGESGSGKSSFSMQIAKEYAKTTKTFYNLLEEDFDDVAFMERIALFNMHEVSENFKVQQYKFKELRAFLQKRGAPQTVVIDSIGYCVKNYQQYETLRDENKDKSLIIIGHADGKNPKTQLEKDIKYDAKQKIFCNGYLAKCQGRTIGLNGGDFIIWEEGYKKINGIIEQ